MSHDIALGVLILAVWLLAAIVVALLVGQILRERYGRGRR